MFVFLEGGGCKIRFSQHIVNFFVVKCSFCGYWY